MRSRSPRALITVAVVALLALAAAVLFDAGVRRSGPGAPEVVPAGEPSAAPTPAAAQRSDAPQRVDVDHDPALAGPEGATAAPASPAVTARGELVVHVRWQDTKSPRTGVVVTVVRQPATPWTAADRKATDEHGVATFVLEPGSYRIATWCAGDAGEVRVEAGRETEFAIAVPRGYTLTGTAVDEWQRGIADASIWLSARFGTRNAEVLAQTDADGRFRIEGLVDHRLVSATAREHAPSLQHEVHAAEGDTCAVTLELRGGGAALAGRIVDARGTAIPDALVRLGDDRVVWVARDETGRGLAAPPSRLLPVDHDGRFVADGLPAGPTRVQAWAAGCAPTRVVLTAMPGGGGEQLVTLQDEAIVFGTVRDPRGAPIAQAQVRYGELEPSMDSAVARSDDAGTFELHGLPAQAVELRAHAPGRGSASVALVLTAGVRTPWNPILDDPAPNSSSRLTGIVVDAANQPLSLLVLQIYEGADFSASYTAVRTDGDGLFAAQVRAESVLIVVPSAGEESGFPRLVAGDVRPADGPARLVVPDPARAFGRITGKVVGPDDAPLRARLTIRHVTARLWRERETDAAGEVLVERVPPGELELEVRAAGHPWLALGKRVVVAGETVQLGTIRLPQAGRIEGTFTLPDGIDAAALQFSIYRDHGPEGAVIRPAEGRFASGPLAPAEYEVRIQGRGVRMFNQRVAVHLGAVSTVHAALEAAIVRRIFVVVPDGTPRPRSVSLQVRDAHGDLAWSGGADAGSQFGTEVSLSPGDYVVHADAEGGLRAQVPLHVGATGTAAEPLRVELRAQD